MEQLTEILKMSPPVVFVVVLNGLGMILSSAKWFKSDYIPVTMLVLGAGVWPFLAETGNVAFTARHPMLLNAVYGAALGLGAVGAHQLVSRLMGGDKTPPTLPPPPSV